MSAPDMPLMNPSSANDPQAASLSQGAAQDAQIPPPPIQPQADPSQSPVGGLAQGAASQADTSPVKPPPGLWRRVLQGALMGLENGGAAGLVEGGIVSTSKAGFKDIQQINDARKLAISQGGQEQASRIRFQNAQAANTIAETAVRDQQLHSLPQEAQDAHNAATVGVLRDMSSLFGTPDLIVDNHHQGATAAMEGLTASDGGVPNLITFNLGDKIVAYRADKLSGNPASVGLINQMRQVTGLEPLNQAQWNQTPKQVQDTWLKQASDFFQPVADAKNLPVQIQQVQQWRNTYAQKPGADKGVLDKLDAKLKFLQAAQDATDKHAVSQAGSEATAKAFGEKTARDAADKQAYQTQLSQGDVTGWTAPPNQFMSEQQFNSAKTKWTSGTYSKAQDVDKSFQMYQDAFANRNNAQTGAGSMLALSQHLGTTFGSIKGSRITKDQIMEHLGARSVSDDAQVAVQKLVNGDKLSEGQWKEFGALITDSRNRTWENAVSQAHTLGIPVLSGTLPADVEGRVKSKASAPAGGKYDRYGFKPL